MEKYRYRLPMVTSPQERDLATHKWYALGLLIIVALFNYIDRQSLSILQVPIKRELGLSDTELGALTGLSFAILYSTLALPIARLADRASRKWIIGAALAIWSLMTGASGFAASFMGLVICRMGVALGEAGCVPATHAIISDYFPRDRRATAIAIWTLSIPLGTMLGFATSGWLNQSVGWRNAFFVLGGAGLALFPIVLATLKEPPRGGADAAVLAAKPPPLARAVATLWRLRAYRHAAFGGALFSYPLYAMLNWNAPFYSRVFGLPLTEIAAFMALATGLGGGIGSYLAGLAADRLGRRDCRWYMWVPALLAIGAVPLMLVGYSTSNVGMSLAASAIALTFVNSYFPPLVATAQSLVGGTMRAFTSAVLVLITNLMGIGLGPFLTGLISDRLATRYSLGAESLRYAIAISALMALWAAFHFARSAVHLPKELAASPSRP